MRKSLIRLVLLVVCAALLIMPSAAAVSEEAMPVAILILDRFQPSVLGLIPNPDFADSFYAEIHQILSENSGGVVDTLQSDPQAGLDSLKESLGSWQGDLAGIIGAEEGEQCIGYLPGLRVDEQGTFYVNGAGGPSGEAHGVLVSEAIVDAVSSYLSILSISNTDQTVLADPTASRPVTYTVEVDALNQPIIVIETDTDNFRLSSITSKIQEVVIAQETQDNQEYLWVINASFAVIPCEFLPELATLEGIVRVLRQYNNEQGAILFEALDDAIAAFLSLTHAAVAQTQTVCGAALNAQLSAADQPQGTEEPEESEAALPTFTYVDGAPSSEHEDCQSFEDVIANTGILVAAAGNAGQDFPFYPASAPGVISVSATNENAPFFATQPRVCPMSAVALVAAPALDALCSNAGEVLMPGKVERMGETYFGTSFAAPRLSLRLAVYLTHNNDDPCMLPSINLPPADTTLIQWARNNCPLLEDTGMNVFQDITPTPP